MNAEEKIALLDKEHGLYGINFRRAGVGFCFYDPPEGYTQPAWNADNRDEWKRYLTIQRYYPTFEEALNAECEKRGIA